MATNTEYPDLSEAYPIPKPPPTPSEYPTLKEAFGGSGEGDKSLESSHPLKDIYSNVKETINNRPELQPLNTSMPSFGNGGPISQAVNAAGQTLALPIRTGETLSQGPEALGEAASNIGNDIGYPKTGAAIGTAISMVPYAAGMVGGLNSLGSSSNPLVRGLVTAPEEIGAEMNVGEKSAGINPTMLPVRRGTIPKFPGLDGLPTNTPPTEAPTVAPMVYPKDTATFLNFARSRVDSLGEQLQPQELADYRIILNNMIKGGEVKAGTKPYALASQLYTDTNSLFTQAIAGREELNQIYKYAKMMPDIGDAIKLGIKKFGPLAVKGAFTAAGMGAGWEGIKHLF